MNKTVNHPEHYTYSGMECIDAIEAATQGLTGFEGYCIGNAIKYLWRWKKKGGAEDLQKAIWYIVRVSEKDGIHDAPGIEGSEESQRAIEEYKKRTKEDEFIRDCIKPYRKAIDALCDAYKQTLTHDDDCAACELCIHRVEDSEDEWSCNTGYCADSDNRSDWEFNLNKYLEEGFVGVPGSV